MKVWNCLKESIIKILCHWAAAECKVPSCWWADRWQLLRPATGRPFCTWGRWHDSYHLIPFPVDDRNNIKLMIPVRNNIVQVDKIELNYCNYKNTFKQWTQNVCRQGSESGLCWPLLNASKQTQHVVKSLLSKSIALLLLLLLAIFNH